MIKNILYSESGGGNSREMMKVLLDLPLIKQAKLHMLHVVPNQIIEGEQSQKVIDGEQIISDAVAELKLEPSQVTTMLREGEPKDIVLSVANDVDADLIVMGSRGLKRLEAILGNSVSQYVFQLTDRPMLLVKDDNYVRRFKKVMVAVDKSPASEYAFDLTLDMLRGYPGVELVLVRVNPDLDDDYFPTRTEMESNPILQPFFKRAKIMDIPTQCIVTGGKPRRRLCELAEEKNVDLLVLGSPDRRPSIAKTLPDLDRLLGTSLSDYIRVNAPCPVLLARSK
jgi:nucleotide-binding universal stress UspA family protein